MIEWTRAIESLKQKLTSWVSGAGEMLPNLIVALLVLAAFWLLAKATANLTRRLLARSKMNRAARELISTLLRVVVVAAGLMVALGVLQLDKALTSVLAGAGVVGLALGFAFQDLAANLISGVGLAVNRTKPFQIGDLIETNDEIGKVKEIDLRTSTIETLDGKQVILPNKQIYQSKVINHSASGSRRVELACGISYGEDLERVAKVVKQAIREQASSNQSSDTQGASNQGANKQGPNSQGPNKQGSPEAEVIWTEFGDSSINFVARFWVPFDSQKQFLMAKSRALVAVKKAFDREDIMIPFPIRTLDFGIRGGVPLGQALPEPQSANAQGRGEKAQWQGDKPQWRGEKAQWQGDKPQWQGDKPQWQSDKPQWQGDKPQTSKQNNGAVAPSSRG